MTLHVQVARDAVYLRLYAVVYRGGIRPPVADQGVEPIQLVAARELTDERGPDAGEDVLALTVAAADENDAIKTAMKALGLSSLDVVRVDLQGGIGAWVAAPGAV